MDFFLNNIGILVTLGVVGLVALIFVWWVLSLRVVVPTNSVHIVQTASKTTEYGKGRDSGNVYYEWPEWIPYFGITVTAFPESIFDVRLGAYEAYDVGRLPFVVDITAFFRIEDSSKAAQRVSNFTELSEQLASVLQGAVRRILGTEHLETIMEDRSGLGDRFTKEVNEQLQEWGVTTVKAIEFMDIRDSNGSQVIKNIMAKEQSRIDRESRTAVAENTQQAVMAEINAQREVDLKQEEARQQVGQRQAEVDQSVGIAKEKSQQAVQEQAAITAEKTQNTARVNQTKAAEIAKEVLKINADAHKAASVVDAEAKAQVQVIDATAKADATEKAAEGEMKAAKLTAQGIEATGQAEGAAEKARLMAPVDTQIALAKGIAETPKYQEYLIAVRTIEKDEAIGKANAEALAEADLKVIVNSGDVGSGIKGIGDVFSAKGGTNIAAMASALAQTEEGKSLLDKVTGMIPGLNKTDK